MARARFQAPKGTQDILPPTSARWERLLSAYATVVERAGYGLIQSPMFEDIGVFQRESEGADAVRKEMYDFLDKGDRRIALRPEGTASIVRAFVQHQPATPWKVWYATPAFRYENVQAGRFRQHHQVGLEVEGEGDAHLTRSTVMGNTVGLQLPSQRLVEHVVRGVRLDNQRNIAFSSP